VVQDAVFSCCSVILKQQFCDATHSRTSKRIPSFVEEGEANLSDLMVKMLLPVVNQLVLGGVVGISIYPASNHPSHRDETLAMFPRSWPAKVCLSCSQLHSTGRRRVSENFCGEFFTTGVHRWKPSFLS